MRVEHVGDAAVADGGGLRHAVQAAAAAAFLPQLGEDFGEAVEEVVRPDFGAAQGFYRLEHVLAPLGGQAAGEVGV